MAIRIRKRGKEKGEHPADYEPIANYLDWAADEIRQWKRLHDRVCREITKESG